MYSLYTSESERSELKHEERETKPCLNASLSFQHLAGLLSELNMQVVNCIVL